MKEGQSRNRKRRRHSTSKPKPQPQNQEGLQSPTKKHKAEANESCKRDEHQTAASASAKRPKPSTFLDKMRARLSGGHFRMLNEKLYTCTGKEALDYFKENPALFNTYHSGYQEQMSHWPELPVNIIIKWLKDRSPSLIVADFGCGDARLAKSVKNKVFSFDLVSDDPSVIACDMSNIRLDKIKLTSVNCITIYVAIHPVLKNMTPLDSSSIDAAVFCLSLMGTNFSSYLQEAHRVLKPRGWLLIAEVKSRFDPNTGGAGPNEFSKAVCDLGFVPVSKDFSNKMFILLYFKKKEKQNSKSKEIEWPELKPCLYKRR
ncbi:Ribosomal RNA-processing protein 8 [Melia azedarach]|uniref:Ribosomal RNA-processing protein 8 n=1 Tax=Melia azedarach TaxID=155640 RepID=A0ACC1YZZ8_MELAZ|nr:Ribosomal RNA-processing protein 8 [Melia azedarach]